MTATIIPWNSRCLPESAATSPTYGTGSNDRNLGNIHAHGSEYIDRLVTGVFESVACGNRVCTSVSHILQVEKQVKQCNVPECRELLRKIDTYLSSPTIHSSKEKPFMMHTRNKVFQQLERHHGTRLSFAPEP